jgi:diguanylate cyclase (GGDEF)-like protein
MMQKKGRILLAEDDSQETVATLGALFPDGTGGLDLTMVSTIATLIPTVKMVDPELILLDLELSLSDPLDAVHLVHRSAPGIPLVVLADPAQKQYAAQSLSEGAMDYVLKGVHGCANTGPRAPNSAGTQYLRGPGGSSARSADWSLHARRIADPRREDSEDAQRTGGALVLICALFENLQTLREGFGPGAPDNALRDVAQILVESCRRSDIVTRLGTEQFAMLAVDAVAPSAPVTRQRLKRRLAVNDQTRSPWGPIDLRLSVGSWSAKSGRTFSEFVDVVESELRQTCPPERARTLVLHNAARE